MRIFVPGPPLAQGNLRRSPQGGMYERNPLLKEWRALVALKAAETMDGLEPSRAGIVLNARFLYVRPSSHLTTKGALRKGAPRLPSRPDLDKLLRAVLDALTGIVFVDDGQVVKLNAGKEYGNVAGAELTWHTIA